MLATQVEATPRFIITLNASTAPEGAIRVPLAITGKWVRGAATFAITRQDLESIVHNFRERQNGEINVDYDHASEMPEVAAGGPVPSAGRIVRLDPPEESKNGSRKSEVGNRAKEPDFRLPNSYSRFLLYGWYEPTFRARQLLQNRECRFISPAIEWSAKNKRSGKSQGTTLTSVALTNRPFLEELPQIRLSDPAWQACHSERSEESAVHTADPSSAKQRTQGDRQTTAENRNSKLETRNPKLALERGPVIHPDESARRSSNFHLPVSNYQFPVSTQGGSMKHVNLSVVDGQIHITHEDLGDEFYFDADDLQSVGALREAPLQASSAALSESAVVTFAQARTLLSEAEARDKFIPAAEVFRAAAEQELDDAVRAGKILPRQRDDWRKIALSDLPTFRKLMGAQKAVVPLAPVGLAGTPPSDVQEQVKFLAEQRMRERHTTFGQALSDIGREQPDLVQQYRRAVSGND